MTLKLSMRDGNSILKASGYTLEEEKAIYDTQLQEILYHTREYLDQLDYMREYKVRWKNYRFETPTLPYEYTKNYTEEE